MLTGHLFDWSMVRGRAPWNYDPTEDGPEVGIIRRELVVKVADLLGESGWKNPRDVVASG